MFGIEDPWVWMAYLLCLVSTAMCMIYGLLARRMRTADDEPTPQDRARAAQEDKLK